MSQNNEIILQPSDFPIILTERAIEMAKRATKEEGQDSLFLRISVKGGGCAGLKYNLDIDENMSNFDIKSMIGDLAVVSDIFSLQYLNGTTVDYEETLDGAGFKFNNPKAKRTCGCGSSFGG